MSHPTFDIEWLSVESLNHDPFFQAVKFEGEGAQA
jgi:hypothetical protein